MNECPQFSIILDINDRTWVKWMNEWTDWTCYEWTNHDIQSGCTSEKWILSPSSCIFAKLNGFISSLLKSCCYLDLPGNLPRYFVDSGLILEAGSWSLPRESPPWRRKRRESSPGRAAPGQGTPVEGRREPPVRGKARAETRQSRPRQEASATWREKYRTLELFWNTSWRNHRKISQ